MKFAVAIALIACIATVLAAPIDISDNNIGNIITVGISGSAVVSNNIDENTINVILALLNQQAAVVAGSDVLSDTVADAPAETQKFNIAPDMIEKFTQLITKD